MAFILMPSPKRKFGLRYYEAFSKQKHVLDILDVEHEWIEKEAKRELTKMNVYLLKV